MTQTLCGRRKRRSVWCERYTAPYQKDYDTLAELLQIDKRICTWACLMFFALQLDRGNISQALSDNMLDDLNINTNDYNYGQTIFYLCFLCAELPSQLISKKLGPDNWIPIQMVSWSLVASLQAFLSGRSSFFACRALLGLIEGTTWAAELVLGELPVHFDRLCLPGFRYSASAWAQRHGRMALVVRSRGYVDRLDRYRIMVLPAAKPNADCEQDLEPLSWKGWVVQ